MSGSINRRAFLSRAVAAAGWSLAVPLFAACSSTSTTSPTAAPAAKPTEAAAKPAESKPAESKPAQAAPAAAGSVTKVSYAMASINPYHIVAITAEQKPELTRPFGIEVETVTTQNSPNAVNALIGGSVNVAAVTPDSAWGAQDKAPDAMQIMAVADGTPYSVITNPDIKKVEDLKGKTIGCSAVKGGADTTAVSIMLFEHGLKEGDYTIIQVGSVAERTAAMKANQIAGCAQLEPQATQLRDAGFPELDNADNYDKLKNAQTIVILSKKGWYEDNAQVSTGFAKGWLAVTKWLYDPANREETIKSIASTNKVDDKAAANAYERHIVKSKTPTADARPDPKKIQQLADNLRTVGTPNLPSDVTKYIDAAFLDKATKA